MLPVSLIFTSGAASGVNSYAAVLVLGLLGRFAHIAAIPPVLEHPLVLAVAAVLYAGQFVVGKVPLLDSVWDVVHTALRPVIGGAIGLAIAQHAHVNSAATIAAAALGGAAALASHVIKTGTRIASTRAQNRSATSSPASSRTWAWSASSRWPRSTRSLRQSSRA